MNTAFPGGARRTAERQILPEKIGVKFPIETRIYQIKCHGHIVDYGSFAEAQEKWDIGASF